MILKNYAICELEDGDLSPEYHYNIFSLLNLSIMQGAIKIVTKC